MKIYLLESAPDKEISISNVSISDEDYQSGNPYNTTFFVRVRSGDFSGSSSFEMDIADFCAFSRELYSLYEKLSGSVALNDICYGSSIEFNIISKLGHIEVKGELFGRAMLHSVKFEFQLDQTDLRKFCESLYEDFGLLDKYKDKAKYNDT